MDERSTGAEDELAGARPQTLLGSIRRYWWLVVLIVAAAIALGLAFNATQGTSYQAISELIITDPRAANPFSVGDGAAPTNQASERYLADQVEILRSSQVAAVASELLEGEFSERQVLRRRNVSGDLTSNRITISFDAPSAEAAKRGSDAVADAYVEVRRRTVRDNADAALRKVDTLLESLKQTADDLGERIGVLSSADETREVLEQQLEDARTRLNDLRLQRDAAPLGGETRVGLNAQIDELLRDFQAWEIVLRVDQPDPELTALIVERDAAIAEQAALTTRRNSLAVDAEVIGEGVALFSPAPLPENPSGFSLDLILAASAGLGLALGAALAYGLSPRRTKLSDKSQPEVMLGAPLVAEVAATSHGQAKSILPIVDQPDSSAAEAFRFIASSISGQQERVLATGEEPARAIAVAAAVADGGRAAVTANTAIAFAQEGHRALVVDADFERQGVTSILAPGLEPTVGLTEVIENGLRPREAIVRIDGAIGQDVILGGVLGGHGTVDLLARGGSGAAAPFVFNQGALTTMMEELTADYDLVLIDSPSLLEVAYAAPVIDLADAILAVVADGQSARSVQEFRNQLDHANVPLVGYVYDRSNVSVDKTRVKA